MSSVSEKLGILPIPRTLLERLRLPTRSLELWLWAILILATFGMRAYLIHLVPLALWSDDASSYAQSALRWIQHGEWITDPRRGPVYSLFIGICVKYLGGLRAVMVVQQGLSALGVLMGIGSARLIFGLQAMVPLFIAGLSFVVYGLPLSLAHLVRNDTLLFFFSSLTFLSWLLALKLKSLPWLCVAAFACGMTGLTKGFVLGPCVLFLLISGFLLDERSRRRAINVALCLLAFLTPTFGAKMLEWAAPYKYPAAPQDGILLYGRTAQFTYLEGGIEPEIKTQIRAEVESYRALGKLNNNLILKRTVVPHLQRILEAKNETPSDLNRLCRRLALEAIAHHPGLYAKQVLGDLYQLNFIDGRRFAAPAQRGLKSTMDNLQKQTNPDLLLEVPAMTQKLNELYARPGLFDHYHRILGTAWLFSIAPILLGSLLMVFFALRPPRQETRLWWIGAATCWFFSEALLCTIGRPLDRYWMPMVPLLFVTLAGGFIRLWQWADRWLQSRTVPPQPSTPLPHL